MNRADKKEYANTGDMGMSGIRNPALMTVSGGAYVSAAALYRLLNMSAGLVGRLLKGLLVLLCTTQSVIAMPHTESSWLLQDGISHSGASVINQDSQVYQRTGQGPANETAYNNLTVTHQGQMDNVDIKTHLTVNYLNAPGQLDDSDQAMQINALYIDASSSAKTVSTRLGRQSYDLAGTAYAVDGMALDYRVGNLQRIKLLAGYPQTHTAALDMDTDNAVYGISAESERMAKYWETDFYLMQQLSDGLVEGQFYGSRLGYLHPRHQAWVRINFDPEMHELQSGNFSYQWIPGGASSVKLALDYRRPGTQAGQVVPALEALLKTMSEDELQSLEDDGNAVFRSAALAWSRPLVHNLKLTGELSVSSLARTSMIGELGSESYYLYGLQLNGSNIIRRKDNTNLGLRYFEHNSNNRFSLFFDNRTPLTPNWHAGMQLEAYWQFNDDQSRTVGIGPLFKLQYNQKDVNRLDLELGMRSSDYGQVGGTGDQRDIFLSITHSRRL